MRWATCIKWSRAFAGVGDGPVMMPFIDLLNHDSNTPSCAERGVWVDEANGEWAAEVVALRDLPAGTEVTYAYSYSPSKVHAETRTPAAATASLCLF